MKEKKYMDTTLKHGWGFFGFQGTQPQDYLRIPKDL